MSTREAADALRVRIPTVISWIAKGLIDARKESWGARWVWRCSEASVHQMQASRGLLPDNDLNARLESLEKAQRVGSAALAEALADWVAAEEAAAQQRIRLMETLVSSGLPGSSVRRQTEK